MATDLGKVGMVMKGDYNSASTYEALDVVSYQNGLYVAKQSVPAGTVSTNTTYWQKAIGKTVVTSTLLYNTAFGAGETVTLSDTAANYDFLDIVTNTSSNLGQNRGNILITVSGGSKPSIWANDYVNSYMRIEVSGASFMLVSAVDYLSQASDRKIFSISGIKMS